VFSTGYLANLGMIGALAAPGDVLVIDGDCHASIYDGCKLSGAEVIRFRHNNAADLDRRLARLGERAQNALVIVEGIYSMLGDQAPLADIAAATHRHGAMLMVDEAHSLGVLGANGRGLCEAAGVMDGVDFVVGTFSKSLGGVGGFCVSPHAELGLVRYTSRPYIFTASPSPATIASTRTALAALRSRPQLRTRLWHNVSRLHAGLTAMGLPPAAEPSPDNDRPTLIPSSARVFLDRPSINATRSNHLSRDPPTEWRWPPHAPSPSQCLASILCFFMRRSDSERPTCCRRSQQNP